MNGAASAQVEASASAGLRKDIKAESMKLPRELLQRHRLRVAGYLLFAHGWIALAVLAGRYLPGGVPAVLTTGFIAIVVAQRCIQTLVHHLSHDLVSRNRRLNDGVGNFLVAGLIGMRVQNYRRVHFIHHAENGSTNDPEFFDMALVSAKGGLLPYIVHFAVGGEALALIKKYYAPRQPAPVHDAAREARPSPENGAKKRGAQALFARAAAMGHVVLCQLALLALFAFVAGAWYLYAVWLYVAVSWSPLLSRLRFLVEHPGKDERTVSTRAPWYETLFFAPYQFNYHFEHHVWPGLPPYYLRRAHRRLEGEGFFQRHPEYLAESFISSLKKHASTS
jgi:fatty acid desaturase